jgi:hypothetical protein
LHEWKQDDPKTITDDGIKIDRNPDLEMLMLQFVRVVNLF